VKKSFNKNQIESVIN